MLCYATHHTGQSASTAGRETSFQIHYQKLQYLGKYTKNQHILSRRYIFTYAPKIIHRYFLTEIYQFVNTAPRFPDKERGVSISQNGHGDTISCPKDCILKHVNLGKNTQNELDYSQEGTSSHKHQKSLQKIFCQKMPQVIPLHVLGIASSNM